LGDAHILPEEKEFQQRFARFLRASAETYDHLFILGDLFEFWFGFNRYSYQREYGIVLEALKEVVSRGTRLIYVEGNHDFNMGPVFSEQLGAYVIPDWAQFNVEGRRWFVTHGDLASARGFRYGTYRKLIKNRLAYGLIHLIGPRLMLGMAGKLAALSHRIYHNPDAYNADRYAGYIEDQFRLGYDVVIMGHTHRAIIKEQAIGGRSCLYVNGGDVKKKETYAVYHVGEGFKIEKGLEADRPRNRGLSDPPAR